MSSPKISIALVCLIALAIPYPSDAQNSAQDFQDAHNAARAQVHVGNLTWNSTMAASAQSYANLRISDCPVGNSSTNYSYNNYSYNWASNDAPFTGVDAVQLWVSGKADYDYNSNTCRNASVTCVTYINVVSNTTTRLGCARVQCTNSRWYVICYYDPPTEFPEERPY